MRLPGCFLATLDEVELEALSVGASRMCSGYHVEKHLPVEATARSSRTRLTRGIPAPVDIIVRLQTLYVASTAGARLQLDSATDPVVWMKGYIVVAREMLILQSSALHSCCLYNRRATYSRADRLATR